MVVIRTRDTGQVLVEDPVLWIGPGADPNLIATIACRREVRAEGMTDEAAVRELVELEGFEYVEPELEPDEELEYVGVGRSGRASSPPAT